MFKKLKYYLFEKKWEIFVPYEVIVLAILIVLAELLFYK